MQLFNYIKTKDGSYTLFSQEHNEAYHNISDGAFNEALYKHVIPAFNNIDLKKSELKILDICFGLGYNSLVTIYYLKKERIDKKVNIYSPELDSALIKSLEFFEYPDELKEYSFIIKSISKELFFSSSTLYIEVVNMDAIKYIQNFEDGFFDIIYQDPFSTKKNPDLWSLEYFMMLNKKMAKNSILTSYSRAKAVREALKRSGFEIYDIKNIGVKNSLLAKKISNN